MCDYSLMMIPNRLACEGEQLVAHGFRNGSAGLVSLADYTCWQAKAPVSFWQKLLDCFSVPSQPTPVVCIPPGARLRLDGIPETLRNQFHLDSSEDVTFGQRSAETWEHRDVLIFANGASVLLQVLTEGQLVRVLKLSSEEAIDPELQREAYSVER
jgi:hypothetical protein